MVTFSDQNDLKTYLNSLQAGYGDRYSQLLWEKEFRASDEIANASEAVLAGFGVLPAHVGNLRAKAGSSGAPQLLYPASLFSDFRNIPHDLHRQQHQ